MAYLLLDREVELVVDHEEALVVTEPSPGVSRGTCARLEVDPARPFRGWRRVAYEGEPYHPEDRDVELLLYEGLEPAIYEAHSTLQASKAIVTYFRVEETGDIDILGHSGDEDIVLAALHGMTVAELRDARKAEFAKNPWTQLEGSARQIQWAETIRDAMLQAVREAGDRRLARKLERVDSASWFIANRDRPLHDLEGRLPVLNCVPGARKPRRSGEAIRPTQADEGSKP